MLRIMRADECEIFLHIGDAIEPNVIPCDADMHAKISKYLRDALLERAGAAGKREFLISIKLCPYAVPVNNHASVGIDKPAYACS